MTTQDADDAVREEKPLVEHRLHPITPFRRAWAPIAVIRRRWAGSSSIRSRQRFGSGRICIPRPKEGLV